MKTMVIIIIPFLIGILYGFIIMIKIRVDRIAKDTKKLAKLLGKNEEEST
jgi:hypothetical protein